MSKTIVTHSGGFHADDVFAVATLRILFPDARIVRSRDPEMISKADIVVDVGGVYDPAAFRFDHHQIGGAGVRENGIPYASFGLVWKEYGEKLCESADVARVIEEKLVMPIDALDNGVEIDKSVYKDIRTYSISDYLYSYWIDETSTGEELYSVFKEVVELAEGLLEREVLKAKRIIAEGEIVAGIYDLAEDKRLIILDKHYAWGKVLVDKPEPLFVVYPRVDAVGWNVKAVRKNLTSFEPRKQFPSEWAGKSGEALQAISGISDAVFCHNGRFIAVADSKDGALKLAEKALAA